MPTMVNLCQIYFGLQRIRCLLIPKPLWLGGSFDRFAAHSRRAGGDRQGWPSLRNRSSGSLCQRRRVPGPRDAPYEYVCKSSHRPKLCTTSYTKAVRDVSAMAVRRNKHEQSRTRPRYGP
jgi:hypothetical protein